MKITIIEREISHTVQTAKYENIKPTIRLVAELDEGEDLNTANKEFNAVIEKMWAKLALTEARWVHKRRKGKVENDCLPELMSNFKEMLKG